MIKINKVDKYFDKGKSNENHVLKDINLELDQKGLVCILGESGSGKTTLLHAIGGLDAFQAGSIAIDDTVIQQYNPKKIEPLRNQKFGYIFQNYYLLKEYTAAYNIKLALNMFDMDELEKEKRVDYVLDALDMKKYKKKLVSQLSGGQQQRVSIARALVKAPDIILADEPTGNLDESNTLKIMGILKNISKKCLVVLVTHERNIAQFFADRIIEIQDGVILKDYSNQAYTSYQRMDDSNIYLKDMEVSRLDSPDIEVAFYQDKERDAENRKFHLDLAWKDGKLYVQSPDDTAIVMAGEGSGSVMLDEHRPKLEQSQAESASYDLANPGTGRRSSLPAGEIWKLACENIRMMGKKRKFIVGVLLVTSVLMVLALADYMMQHSVDTKTVVTDDSHYVTVSLEMGKSISSLEMEKLAVKYIEKYVENGKYKGEDCIVNSGVINIIYDGFTQLKQAGGRLKEYAIVSDRHLDKKDLVYGRMPENRNEAVIDRWLVDVFRSSGSVLGEAYRNAQAMVGTKMQIVSQNMQVEIVGVSDTHEPSLYVKDNAMLGFCYGGYSIMTDQELKEMYPGKYDDLSLKKNELLVSKKQFKRYKWIEKEEAYSNTVMEEVQNTLAMPNAKIMGAFPNGANVKYVISEQDCWQLQKALYKRGYRFKVYTDDVEATAKYFQQVEKDFENLEVHAECNYNEQMAAYQKAQRKASLNAGYLVTVAAAFLSAAIIYFTVKSNAMARSEELTVYRLIGISPGSVLKAYVLEMVLVTAYTCIPAILITSGIIKFIASIPSLQIYLLFPWWMAFALIIALLAANSLISILPVWGILRKPPAQLAAKG